MNITYSSLVPSVLIGKEIYIYGAPMVVFGSNTVISVKNKKNGYKLPNSLQDFLQKEKLHITTIDIAINPENIAEVICAIAIAYELTHGKTAEKELINKLVYKFLSLDKDKNTDYSGALTTASVYGATVYTRKEFAFLKPISVLPHKLPKKFELHVPKFEKQFTYKDIEHNILQLEKCIKRAVVALGAENYRLLQEEIREYYNLLKIETHVIETGASIQGLQKLA